MWLFGDVKAVSADIKVVTGRYGDCDEAGTSLMRFASGVTGTLTAGWVDIANPVKLIVAGTEGQAVIVNGALHFESKKVEGSSLETALDRPSRAPPDAPLAPVRGRRRRRRHRSPGDPGEAAARVVVMAAMYEASAEGSLGGID